MEGKTYLQEVEERKKNFEQAQNCVFVLDSYTGQLIPMNIHTDMEIYKQCTMWG